MRLNQVFEALADPTRREILQLLRPGELTAGTLTERVTKAVSKPSMSHHFDVLKNADLITLRRVGQQVYYVLNTTVVEDLVAMIWDLFSEDRSSSESKP